jgi:hypothetical protein
LNRLSIELPLLYNGDNWTLNQCIIMHAIYSKHLNDKDCTVRERVESEDIPPIGLWHERSILAQYRVSVVDPAGQENQLLGLVLPR